MATCYYPNSDGSGQGTTNGNVNYRIMVTTSIVSSSARTVKLTAVLQFRNTANWSGTYYSNNIPWEYELTVGSTTVGTGSTWSMTDIREWTTLLTAEATVTAVSDGSVTFNVGAKSLGTPTPGRITTLDIEDTIESVLPVATTTYNITFYPDGGRYKSSYDTVWRTSSKTYTVAKGATIANVQAEKTGYKNIAWRTAANGGGTKILDNGGSLTNIQASWNLYPQWQISSYYVYYMINSEATESWLSNSVNYNGTVTITSSTPTKDGYTFLGWNTKKDGTGSWYYKNNTFSMPANDIYLYAIWYIEPDSTILNEPSLKQIKVKNNSQWVPIYESWVKDNGQWITLNDYYCKKNGNWE